MSDVFVALALGSALWLGGCAGVVVAVVSGATLFAPFAAVLIPLGIAYCVTGIIWAVI